MKENHEIKSFATARIGDIVLVLKVKRNIWETEKRYRKTI